MKKILLGAVTMAALMALGTVSSSASGWCHHYRWCCRPHVSLYSNPRVVYFYAYPRVVYYIHPRVVYVPAATVTTYRGPDEVISRKMTVSQ